MHNHFCFPLATNRLKLSHIMTSFLYPLPQNGNNDLPARKQQEFRVMSYNILADSYAQEHRRELYSNVPNFALAWARRKSMIVKEVEEWEPDVVCFQEVDHYSDLEDALQRHGCVYCSIC